MRSQSEKRLEKCDLKRAGLSLMTFALFTMATLILNGFCIPKKVYSNHWLRKRGRQNKRNIRSNTVCFNMVTKKFLLALGILSCFFFLVRTLSLDSLPSASLRYMFYHCSFSHYSLPHGSGNWSCPCPRYGLLLIHSKASSRAISKLLSLWRRFSCRFVS